MTNANDFINGSLDTREIKDSFGNYKNLTGVFGGLTKREYIATQISIGLSVQAIAGKHNLVEEMEINVPMFAVRIADALINELNKTK